MLLDTYEVRLEVRMTLRGESLVPPRTYLRGDIHRSEPLEDSFLLNGLLEERRRVTFGSGPDCELSLAGLHISQEHGYFEYDPDTPDTLWVTNRSSQRSRIYRPGQLVDIPNIDEKVLLLDPRIKEAKVLVGIHPGQEGRPTTPLAPFYELKFFLRGDSALDETVRLPRGALGEMKLRQG